MLFLASNDPNLSFFIMMGAIMLVFYFFMIRPQNNKVKQQRLFLEDLQKGDHVITGGGIHGKVYKIEDAIVTLEIGKGAFIRVEKDVISKEMTERLDSDDRK